LARRGLPVNSVSKGEKKRDMEPQHPKNGEGKTGDQGEQKQFEFWTSSTLKGEGTN